VPDGPVWREEDGRVRMSCACGSIAWHVEAADRGVALRCKYCRRQATPEEAARLLVARAGGDRG